MILEASFKYSNGLLRGAWGFDIRKTFLPVRTHLVIMALGICVAVRAVPLVPPAALAKAAFYWLYFFACLTMVF